MKPRLSLYVLFLLCLFCGQKTNSFDQSVFYYARFFPGEPRLAKDNLTSIDFTISGGSTIKRIDECGFTLPRECFNRYRTQHFLFDLAHNFCGGWFITGNLPIHRIHVIENPDRDCDFTSVANMNLTTGWAVNYEDTEKLDFIDITLESGIILPTAKNAQSKGILFHGACSLGLYDWLTWGIDADIITFFDHKNGRLWDVAWYAKADHIIRGFSFLFGHSHSNQTTTLVPWSCETLPFWSMDTFHFIIEYDTASYSCTYAPRIEFFYNHILNGKNIIHNSIFGLQIGTDF